MHQQEAQFWATFNFNMFEVTRLTKGYTSNQCLQTFAQVRLGCSVVQPSNYVTHDPTHTHSILDIHKSFVIIIIATHQNAPKLGSPALWVRMSMARSRRDLQQTRGNTTRTSRKNLLTNSTLNLHQRRIRNNCRFTDNQWHILVWMEWNFPSLPNNMSGGNLLLQILLGPSKIWPLGKSPEFTPAVTLINAVPTQTNFHWLT